MEDRALRSIISGLGGANNAPVRETGFDIVTASEIMAVLALSSDLEDLRGRLKRIVVGATDDRRPRDRRGDRGCRLAHVPFCATLYSPTWCRRPKGSPSLCIPGPLGTSPTGAARWWGDRLARSYVDYVLTEAGFGADLGFEKYIDIKARSNGLEPSAVVMVTTVRAMKSHGGVRFRDLDEANMDAVEKGCAEPGAPDRRDTLLRTAGCGGDQRISVRHAR